MARISTVDRLTALRAELAGAGVTADKLLAIDRQIVSARGVLFGTPSLTTDDKDNVVGVTVPFTRNGAEREYVLLAHGDHAALYDALMLAARTLAPVVAHADNAAFDAANKASA